MAQGFVNSIDICCDRGVLVSVSDTERTAFPGVSEVIWKSALPILSVWTWAGLTVPTVDVSLAVFPASASSLSFRRKTLTLLIDFPSAGRVSGQMTMKDLAGEVTASRAFTNERIGDSRTTDPRTKMKRTKKMRLTIINLLSVLIFCLLEGSSLLFFTLFQISCQPKP